MSTVLIRFIITSFSAVCLVAAVSLTVCAQQPTQPKPSPTPLQQDTTPIRIPVRRVRLPITVQNKKGDFVPGLTQSDFVILEDKIPQAIETFSDDVSQLPLYVAVLMDTSPSTAGKLKFQQESAMNFIQT
ncbi:MAG TPA: hypothetical protein VJS17_07410, partial [Pyrinomonadaceae bacterium]|nr:hypothetical protein [Pyrinomonadaceae bacterium]